MEFDTNNESGKKEERITPISKELVEVLIESNRQSTESNTIIQTSLIKISDQIKDFKKDIVSILDDNNISINDIKSILHDYEYFISNTDAELEKIKNAIIENSDIEGESIENILSCVKSNRLGEEDYDKKLTSFVSKTNRFWSIFYLIFGIVDTILLIVIIVLLI